MVKIHPELHALTSKQAVPINDFYTSIAMAPVFCGLRVKFGKDNTERHTRGSKLSDGMWSKKRQTLILGMFYSKKTSKTVT